MKKLFIIIALSIASMPAFAVTSIKAEINGMVCAFCAKGIEKKLKALSEGAATYVDLKSRVVALELKDGAKIPLEKFKSIIEEAGYSVKEAKLVEQSVAEIKSEMSKGAKE
jgi:copper chaperone CopZ